jgi:hypothetical protein
MRILLVAARIRLYFLTIGKGNDLCYHPPVPDCLQEQAFADCSRQNFCPLSSPTERQNRNRSLAELKQLVRTYYSCASQCHTFVNFGWWVCVYSTRDFLSVRAELSVSEGSCLRANQSARQYTYNKPRHHIANSLSFTSPALSGMVYARRRTQTRKAMKCALVFSHWRWIPLTRQIMQAGCMKTDITVTAEDRVRLERLVADRNTPAKVVLAGSNRAGHGWRRERQGDWTSDG